MKVTPKVNRRAVVAASLSLACLPRLARAQSADEQALVARAIKEGSLSVWDTVIDQPTSVALIATFLKRFNLPGSFKVGFNAASSGNLVTRVDQELAAGNVTIDVAGVAAPVWAYEHARKGDMLHYDSPEYAAYSEALKDSMGVKGLFVPSCAYTFVPCWNADDFTFTGHSYQDLINAVPAGRLTMGDATVSVSSLSLYLGLRKALGPAFYESYAKKKPLFIIRGENMLSRVVTGEDLVAMQMEPARIAEVREQGANVKMLWPSDGVVVLPQETFILRGAPHPAAAKLWMDFILSDAGQTIIVHQGLLMSVRDGFVSPNPEYAPSVDKIKVVPVDWSKVTNAQLDQARDEWTKLFKH